MSLVSSQIRMLFLTFRQNDLEYKLQLISQTKMGLASSASDLLNVGSDLDPDSPEMKKLEQRRAKLNQIEKKLDAEMLVYQGQLKMVEKETESVKSMLDKSIDRAFSYGK
jgi:capsule polysaccharide export protein KpsE/RkpR